MVITLRNRSPAAGATVRRVARSLPRRENGPARTVSLQDDS
jgi:hypothetical protein